MRPPQSGMNRAVVRSLLFSALRFRFVCGFGAGICDSEVGAALADLKIRLGPRSSRPTCASGIRSIEQGVNTVMIVTKTRARGKHTSGSGASPLAGHSVSAFAREDVCWSGEEGPSKVHAGSGPSANCSATGRSQFGVARRDIVEQFVDEGAIALRCLNNFRRDRPLLASCPVSPREE